MGSEAPTLWGESIILPWLKTNDDIFHLFVVLTSISARKRGKTFSFAYRLLLVPRDHFHRNVSIPGEYSQTRKFRYHRDITQYGLEF